MAKPILCVGIDENGLGPRLGPLIVTAVTARVTDAGRTLIRKKPRGALAKRLGDSKAFLSHGNVALGEAWARALGARMRVVADGPDALLRDLALETRAELSAPCPDHVAAQCWNAAGESFEAENKLVDKVSRDLAGLADRGVDITSVRTSIVCTKRINEAKERGVSRFVVDLHAMERALLAAKELHAEEVDVVCGKVGGYARYSDAFGPLGGRLHAIVEEGAKRSAYRFPGVGDIAFVRDADENDVLVAMASMVGKWARELLMARIVRFYGTDAGGEPYDASGYHDPVTAKFVRATALVRKKRKIPDACFERIVDPAAQT